MFEAISPSHSELQTTIIQGKSSLRLPGQPKRIRILGSSEVRQRPKKIQCEAVTCKICSRIDCSTRFCQTLAQCGHIIKSNREHQYDHLLSIDIPITSLVEQCDFTSDPFPKSWEFVIIENVYRDEKGFKYARLIGLNKTLDIQQPKDLFTFTALTQWLQTKPKRKEILFKTGKNYTTELDWCCNSFTADFWSKVTVFFVAGPRFIYVIKHKHVSNFVFNAWWEIKSIVYLAKTPYLYFIHDYWWTAKLDQNIAPKSMGWISSFS